MNLQAKKLDLIQMILDTEKPSAPANRHKGYVNITASSGNSQSLGEFGQLFLSLTTYGDLIGHYVWLRSRLQPGQMV